MSTSYAGATSDNVDRALAALDWTTLSSCRERFTIGQSRLFAGSSAGFTYVANGRATLDDGERRTLVAGDMILWPRGFRARLHADTDADVVHVTVTPSTAPTAALAALPSTIVVREFDAAEPAVTGLVEAMDCGPTSPLARAGDVVICSRIATTVVSVVIRAWLERGCAPDLWADRLADPELSKVIDALHAEPGRMWTVDELAREATMSRSAFAERFRDLTGTSPASYLTGVRMDAAKRLLSEGAGVAATAHRLGYESEAGFSRAFRRHTGQPPARWRRSTAG
ncbi:AraC family transcriptional regulator [Gordonia spumicola]|uniref:AraC family transcriptional regulator n=1 Tax=Gordonia spumicola TaxID=589161 RepID=A0A7I9V7R8_9ACTN|nr:helix-turn-helix domain-containing protein [Gordonia spumicola]GEE01274.1 AraC family transcriptional regulator [Gordonia spumicola]